jgi:hypothetical protein
MGFERLVPKDSSGRFQRVKIKKTNYLSGA